MAAIKGSHIGHYAALKADSSKPSAPPESIYDYEINPYPTELPHPEIDPSPTQLPYPDKNPCWVGPLGTEFPYRKWASDSPPAQNGAQ